MKNFSLILLLICYSSAAQIRQFNEIPSNLLNSFHKMGKEETSILNEYECKYFNVIFNKYKEEFNFCSKKIVFFRGNNATFFSNKYEIFKQEAERFDKSLNPVSCYLIIFNENERLKTDYDAAIVYWSKFHIRKEKLIEKIINEK